MMRTKSITDSVTSEASTLAERFRLLVAPYRRKENISRYTRRVLKRLQWRDAWLQVTNKWFGILRPWAVTVENLDYSLAQWRASDPHWLDRVGDF